MIHKLRTDPDLKNDGVVECVRFSGQIVDMDPSNQTIVIQAQIPGSGEEYIRGTTKLTFARFNSAKLFDRITGHGSVSVKFDRKSQRSITTLKPKLYVIRDKNGAVV